MASTNNENIVVLTLEINNEVIANLRVVDDYDTKIKELIDALAEKLTDEGTEVYEVGNTFIVTENEILVAGYQDEVTEEITEP